MIFIIIAAAFCALTFAGDVITSKRNKSVDGIEEENKIFQDKNGDANVSKLILYKALLFAGASVVVIILYIFGAGAFAAFIYLAMAGITLPTVINNNKLRREHLEKVKTDSLNQLLSDATETTASPYEKDLDSV